MNIESITYFEIKGRDCQVAYGWQSENDELLNNPPLIVVSNFKDMDDSNVIIVDNTHESCDEEDIVAMKYETIGIWRIVYKAKDYTKD